MTLRQHIFVRTISLLAALIVVCCLSIAASLVRQNRNLWLDHCRDETLFVAEQSDRLVLWDDRVALHDLLEDLVGKDGHFRYAFIEKGGAPYVHTFTAGVPKRLLEDGHGEIGETVVETLSDADGEVFYDISSRVAEDDTCVHLGMDRDVVDTAVGDSLRTISVLGGIIFILCLYPAWLSAGGITHEVDKANADLQRLNTELESRVEKRTAELRRANVELEREMSKRVKLEKRQADFYAMMRHDIRNTLSIIGANAELLRTDLLDRLDENTGSMLKAIQDNSHVLSDMVEGLAVISRIDSEEYPLKLQEIAVADLLTEAGMGLTGKVLEKGLKLVKNVPQGLPPVRADENYMRRALLNVLTNAVNYTPHGGTVKIDAHHESGDGGDYVVVSVSDTGPGIEPAEAVKVFDMYYRSTAARGVRGSGLGLAIAKEVMEAHGGRIELESTPGSGSTFRLVMPVDPGQPAK